MKITRRDAIISTAIGISGLPTDTLASPISRPSEPELFLFQSEPPVDQQQIRNVAFSGSNSFHRQYMEKARRSFRAVAAGLYVPAYRNVSTKFNTVFAAWEFQANDNLATEYTGTDFEFDIFCLQMEKVADHFRSMRLPVELVSLNFTSVTIDPVTFAPIMPFVMEWNE